MLGIYDTIIQVAPLVLLHEIHWQHLWINSTGNINTYIYI